MHLMILIKKNHQIYQKLNSQIYKKFKIIIIIATITTTITIISSI